MQITHKIDKEGKVALHVTLAGPYDTDIKVTITEEQWDELENARLSVMRPIWDARSKAKQRAAAAEDKRKMLAAQRVVEVDGVKVRVQRHWGSRHGYIHNGSDVAAWLDGHEPEVAPFYVRRLGMHVGNDWGIEGNVERRRYDGWPIRSEVFSAKGATLRFGSFEAAIRKAVAFGLDKVEAAP